MQLYSTMDRPSGNVFPPTQWELVEAAAEPESGLSALERLLEIYLPFLEAHIIRQFGVPPDQAKDLLQSFVLDKVIQKNLYQSADRARGKFRNFLMRSLGNYVIQQQRRDGAHKRAATNLTVPLDELPESHGHELRAPEPDGFDVAWARGLLTETLRCMKAECETGGRLDLWGIFEGRLLGPLVEDAPPTPYEELMSRFGFTTMLQAANALTTAKRMFSRHLRAQVARYVEGEAAIQAELEQLKQILLQAGTELSSSRECVGARASEAV